MKNSHAVSNRIKSYSAYLNGHSAYLVLRINFIVLRFPVGFDTWTNLDPI